MGPLSSTEVLGDYLVRRVVTSDQNRSVVAAEHRPSRRAVALTVWPARLLDADRTRALLGRLDVLRGIHHDNLAAIVDAGTLPDGGVFAAAEWIDGPTLESVIARGPLPLTRAHAVLKGVATGIAAAHDRGVLHGDLRPAHVLLATSGAGLETPKVTNLGTGNAWAAIGAGTGALPDSPAYLSPEQCRGERNLDQRSDVYSLGVMAYELLTGRRPFESKSAGELLVAHLTLEPPVPTSVAPTIADALMRALAKQPGDRFASLPELVAAVTSAPVAAVASPKTTFLARAPANKAQPLAPGGTRKLPAIAGGTAEQPVTNDSLAPPAARASFADSRAPRRSVAVLGLGATLAVVAAVTWTITRQRPDAVPPTPRPAVAQPPPVPDLPDAAPALERSAAFAPTSHRAPPAARKPERTRERVGDRRADHPGASEKPAPDPDDALPWNGPRGGVTAPARRAEEAR